MATLYKGYAQQKGFGAYLVKAPDPSEKIRRQGLDALGHMKDAVEWNNKQANRLTDALVANAAFEEKNRRENFELGQDLSQTVHDQKMRNFDDRIKADKARQLAEEKKWKSILSLTQSGAQLFQAYKNHQEKAGKDYAHMVYEETGIGLAKLNGIQDIQEEVWNDSSAREARLTEMGLEGVDPVLIQQLRSLSGYKKLAISKADARRWALRRPGYYQDNWNTQLEIPGVDGPISLADAQGEQVDTILQILDKRARNELGPNAPTTKILALSGSYQLLENARAAVRSQKTDARRQEVKKEQYDDEYKIINDHFFQPDGSVTIGAGIVKSIEYYAGPNPTPESYRRATTRVFNSLIEGTKSGVYDPALFDEKAGSHTFKHSSGNVRLDVIFRRQWLELEDAAVNGAQREYNVANIAVQTNKAEDSKYLGELMNLDFNEIDAEGIRHMLNLSQGKDWQRSTTYLNNKLTRLTESDADKTVIAIVQDKVRNNVYMNREDIEALGGSVSATSAAIKLMEENSPFMPERYNHSEEIENTIDALLETQIPTPLTGKQDYTRDSAKKHALIKARAQYKAFMTKPGANPDDALTHSLQYIKDEILNGASFAKEFDEQTGQFGFAIGMIKGRASEINTDYSTLATKVQKNKGSIYTETLMSESSLRAKSDNLNKGIHQELLPRSVFIESASGGTVKALEAEQAQIELINKRLKEEGKPLIREYPKEYINKVQDTYKRINPSVIRLLNKHDYCKVNQAACTSGNQLIYARPLYQKTRNIVRSTLGTHESGDYNATENGDSTKRADLNKINIKNASLAEITTLQERGLLITAGRYQFTLEQLSEAMELAGIPMSATFDADTQNKLFDAYFKKNGATMIKEMENDEDRFFLEDAFNSVTSDKMSNLKFNSPSTLSMAAYKELYNRGTYNAA